MHEDFNLWLEAARVFPVIFSIEAGRYVIAAGLMSLVLWAFWRVYFRARKLQPRVARARDYAREILASLRTALIFALVGFAMYLASKAGWLTIHQGFGVRGPIYFAVTLVLMILAQDAYFYWTHRAMHHPRLFRLFHRTHHTSRTPTPWTAYAFDAPEAVVMVTFVPLWAALVPMHDAALAAFVTWQIVRNVMGHAGSEPAPVSGRPSRLFGWLTTTTHHDLHHEDARANYGLYFTWWDRLMGTEHAAYQARIAEIAARAGATGAPASTSAKVAALVLVGLVISAAAASVALGRSGLDITGLWATRGLGSIVELSVCEDAPDALCGRIVWLWEAHDSEGRPRTDARNPDDALQARPLVGVEIVHGLRETATGVWGEGSLYNPDDGRTYRGVIRLVDGALELRGCALRLLCRMQTWRRPEELLAAVEGLEAATPSAPAER